MKGVTAYQLELLTTLSCREAATGRLTDLDQLLETLSWVPSKESAQFTIRALVARGFIAKAPLESRRGRNRICYRLLEAGRLVLDPRRLASMDGEKAEERAENLLTSGMPEDVLEMLEIDLSLRDF